MTAILCDKVGAEVKLGDVLFYPDRSAFSYQVSDIPGSFARQGYCYAVEIKKRGPARTPIIIQPPLMLHKEG